MNQSFSAVYRSDARILILGSMPGIKSLDAQEYYAHPRNAFWPIMAKLCDFSLQLNYSQRLEQLKQHGIALWDVIARCQRQGSLDSAIDNHSIIVNDFPWLFTELPQLQIIGLNGSKAAQMFQRHIVKVGLLNQNIQIVPLPSTSPAHARLTVDAKFNLWQALLKNALS